MSVSTQSSDTWRLPTAERTGVGVPAIEHALVIALIPAYNEEEQIADAIRSLQEHVAPPDMIVVCADNCTDNTADIAEAAGAYVFETVGNEHKKAGALNQALDRVLPALHDEDAILVMDADSILVPTFISEAQKHLRNGFGGVGAPRPALHAAAGLTAAQWKFTPPGR
jgi:cellulose synthase/poly-beta-1,6-N-acetylglucosamine synthase-like glycosyltransferase